MENKVLYGEKEPTFSVIIPIYNVAKYLKYCLDSIQTQSFSDFEAILVDDGSTDECPIICDQIAKGDSRFVVIHQNNQGLLMARRNGLQIARGKYIVHVDSDDVCSENLLITLYRTIIKEEADLSIYNFELIDEDNRLIEEKTPAFGNGKQSIHIEDKEIIIKKMLSTTEINTIWIKCAKRSIVDISTDYSQYRRLMMGEDVLQSMPLIENAEKIIYIPDSLYKYRYNRNGMSRIIKKSYIFDFLNVRRRIYDLIKKCSMSQEVEDLLYKNYSHYLVNYLLKESLVCQTRDEYRELKQEIASLLLPVDISNYLERTTERFVWILCRHNFFYTIRLIAKVYFNRRS